MSGGNAERNHENPREKRQKKTREEKLYIYKLPINRFRGPILMMMIKLVVLLVIMIMIVLTSSKE